MLRTSVGGLLEREGLRRIWLFAAIHFSVAATLATRVPKRLGPRAWRVVKPASAPLLL